MFAFVAGGGARFLQPSPTRSPCLGSPSRGPGPQLGGCTQRGHLGTFGGPRPPPPRRGGGGRSPGVSCPHFIPADRRRPARPAAPPRPGRLHLLVYPVSGLRRGHQSRKQRAGRARPGCPARGGPAVAAPRLPRPLRSRGVLPGLLPGGPPRRPRRGAREPPRPSQSQLRERDRALGPRPPSSARLPAGVFLALSRLFAAAVWLGMT